MKIFKNKLLIISLIFVLLGVVYTYPLIIYFTRGMPYTQYAPQGYEVVPLIQGDYLQLYYKLWLFRDAVCGETPFFSDPYQFNISDGTMKFSMQFLPLSFVFLVFSFPGLIFAYNALVILSFVMAGVSMYLLVKFYTRREMPSFIGGLIFSLVPFRTSQLLGGHPNGFLLFLIPLSVYFLEKALSEKNIKYSIFAGLCIFSLAFMELHLVYYLVLFLVPLILFRVFLLVRSGEKGWWRQLAPVFCFMFLSFLWIYFSRGLEGSIAGGGRSLQEVELHSPYISDLFRRVNPRSERFIYLGIVPLLLALFSIPLCFQGNRRGREGVDNRKIFIMFYFLVFLVAVLLSPGPNMCWRFSLYRLAAKLVPYFRYPRAMGRIMVFGFLSLSILAGFGLSWFQDLNLGRRIKFAVFAVFLAGILIDYFPSRPVGISLPKAENKVYRLVKEDLGDQRLLELPIWPGDSSWSSIYLYYVTKTRAKIINGYSSMVSRKYVEDIFIPLYNLDFGEMRQAQYSLLKKLNVKYIIFHKEAYPRKVSAYPPSFAIEKLKNSGYVELVKCVDPLWLFSLLDTPRPAPEEVFSMSSVVGIIYEAEKMCHRGRVERGDTGASGEGAVLGSILNDKEDYLVFGPYRTFPTGRYKAIFRLKADNNSSPERAARIEVSTDKGKKIIEERIVYSRDFSGPDTYQDFILPFELKEPQRLEFRVRFYKKVNLWVDYVYIIFADQKDPLLSCEAEDLFHIGTVIPDQKARGGEVVYAGISSDRKDTTRDYLNNGPNRIFPPGRYRVYFRLKVDDLTEDEVARIEVTANRRREKLACSVIKGRAFEDAGEFKEFALTFDLKAQQALEFLVFFSGNSHLWFDSIRIEEI